MDKRTLIIRRRGARQLLALLAVLLAVSVCIAAPTAYANEGADAETAETSETSETTESTQPAKSKPTTINELRDSLNDVRNELDAARKQVDDAEKELEVLASQITILEALIQETENEINALQLLVTDAENKLFDLTQQIVAMDMEVNDQNSALNKRLRIMYLTDDDKSMLAVVLGSENFVDLMANLEMVRRIHETDKAFLAELEKKLNELELKKVEAEEIERDLKSQRTDLRNYKDSLDADKYELAVAQQRAKEIRDAAAAEIERLEAESKRIAEELANMTSQWGDYAGGAMAWPGIGPVTSEFGMRYHPISGRYSMHTGIDIGVPTGYPVHAAADGIVYYAGYNGGGYGNLVMIDNGSGIVTMYAHNSGFACSVGQIVYRGDVIAYAGSTGNSTGPHIHFEVRVNGSPQNPRGWLG